MQTSTASRTDEQRSAPQPIDPDMRLSVSRRMKIGTVLLLTLIGYFLMGERPQPAPMPAAPVTSAPAASDEMQQFVDDLEFVSEDEAQAAVSAASQNSSMQLPAPPAAPPSTAPQAAPAPAYQAAPRHQSLMAAADTHEIHEPQQRRVYQTYAHVPEVRTVLRFTGRIEPVR